MLQLPAGLDGLIDENCSRLALDVLVASHHSWVWIHSSSLSCEFSTWRMSLVFSFVNLCRLQMPLLKQHGQGGMHFKSCKEHSRVSSAPETQATHEGTLQWERQAERFFFPKKTLQVWPVAFRGVFVSAFSTDDETKVVHFHPG